MASLPRSPHQRLQSDTRMDVLSTFMGSKAKANDVDNSPRDSLSPCDEYFEKNLEHQGETTCIKEKRSDIAITITGPDSEPNLERGFLHLDGNTTQAGTPRAQTKKEHSKISFLEPWPKHKQTTPSRPVPQQAACPPRFRLSRSHRPSDLYIDNEYGLTTATIDELKHSIRGAGPSQATNRTIDYKPLPSPPPRPRRRLPKSPPPPPPRSSSRGRSATRMGNQHSHHALSNESALDDSASISSVLRSTRTKGVKIPRRSSINVFKRMGCESPLPPDFTATVIEVPRAATAPNLDGMGDGDTEGDEDEQERGRARHLHRHSAPSPSLPVRSPSPDTLTEELAARPESAVDTITDRRAHVNDTGNEASSQSHLRVSALSPTLPTPSPLPEDSPHKYGLKDRMDTPEMPSPDLKVAKAKRRSSGLEIFNEAKSLQSAASFLNGLSTARRRAESRAQSRNATDSTTATTAAATTSYGSGFPSLAHLPLSTNPSTVQLSHSSPASASQLQLLTDAEEDLVDRNRGHTTKSSGFTYARPLNINQLKCYRSHARMMPSKNKNVPVECAVCHIDDEKDHFACSWCALRMCRFCRRDFYERGDIALRERIRMAEMGSASVENEVPVPATSGQASAAGVVRIYG